MWGPGLNPPWDFEAVISHLTTEVETTSSGCLRGLASLLTRSVEQLV